MTTLKEIRLITFRHLQILKARKARQAGEPDLKLLLEIEDHEKAITLIDEALTTQLTEPEFETFKTELRKLNIASNDREIDFDTLQPEIPRQEFEPETILIPGGPFLMGCHPADNIPLAETPQHEVRLGTYEIGKYPVTNAQYAAFVQQNQEHTPTKAGWQKKNNVPVPPQDKLDHPVVRVTWYDAVAYCRWLTKQTNRVYRLPSEAEWEKAATWIAPAINEPGSGRKVIYPWGDDWVPTNCNHNSDDTTPVSQFQEGVSPYGCYDMVGNVQEWTNTLWGSDPHNVSDFPYPYKATDGREGLEAPNLYRIYRVHRGGGFIDTKEALRCTARQNYDPDGPSRWRGFRIVLEH
ncbi:MAG: formylglycine-generating enzyme family protein [Anaerolineae bacterium]|nr:formylglycine-generating enzyme family protein [Anaerolineae bacterium]